MTIIKTENEIKIMRMGGKILSSILKRLAEEVRAGITTADLENLACELIQAAGGRPAFKGYKSGFDSRPYPTALCTSINSEIVHAPSLPERELKNGDIIGIDVGMEYPYQKGKSGLYTDMATTVAVGEVGQEVARLLSITKESLMLAIKQVKPGNYLSDIGRAVQYHAESASFSVVRDLVGHGVGKAVHEDPQIPNYEIRKNDLDNIQLKPGMTLAIEPMVNMGSYKIKVLSDGFTIATKDNSLSAHFEHTVAVTGNGCEILTA